MIGIINYGAGNIGSVACALERVGADFKIIERPDSLSIFQGLLLPGVGSFRTASSTLGELGWFDALPSFVERGGKLMGICLGMQLLFDTGTEDGLSRGLGLIEGTCELIPESPGFSIPHIGWNHADWQQNHPLIDGIKSGIDFYHVHSYHCIPSNPENILSKFDYNISLVNAVISTNVAGFQFHPEKSQPAGLQILSNFIDWSESC